MHLWEADDGTMTNRDYIIKNLNFVNKNCKSESHIIFFRKYKAMWWREK